MNAILNGPVNVSRPETQKQGTNMDDRNGEETYTNAIPTCIFDQAHAYNIINE